MTQSDESAEVRIHGGTGIRTELRDLQTGINNGWSIPTETLAAVPAKMLEFISNGSRREAIGAAKVLVSLIRHNASTDSPAALHLHSHTTAPTDETEPLKRLTQQAAAKLLGCTPRHLRDHQPARNADGTYNGPDLVQWSIDKRLTEAKQRWQKDSSELRTAATRQAEARAVKLEEQAKALKGTYVEREEIERDFGVLFGRRHARLSSLATECANSAPREMQLTIKSLIDDRVRIALKELTDGVQV